MSAQTPAAPDYTVTTFDHIVIEKERLLAKLKENRAAHELIYKAAVSGYWHQCAVVLDAKKASFSKAVKKLEKSFKNQYIEMAEGIDVKDKDEVGSFSVSLDFYAVWPLSYPTNHIEDYQKAITMLEYSVADKVSLSATDFNAYVRNEWSWRKGFVDQNISYVNMVTGCMFSAPLAISGMAAIASDPVYQWANSNSSVT